MFSVLLHIMHSILIIKAHWHVHEHIHCLRYRKYIPINTSRRFKGRIKDFSNMAPVTEQASNMEVVFKLNLQPSS